MLKKLEVTHIDSGRPVTSTDKRKAAVVAAFKKEVPCGKVTQVVEVSRGTFQAKCMRKDVHGRRADWTHLGCYEIELPEFAP